MSFSSKGGAAGIVLLVTVIEDLGLIAWLVLVQRSILYVGIPIAALVLLGILLMEHSIMQRAENPNFTGGVFLRIVGFFRLSKWSTGVSGCRFLAPTRRCFR